MLSRKKHLSSDQIRTVLRKGQRFQGDGFMLCTIRSQPPPLFGVMVSKKIAQRAVDRACLRRQTYHQIALFEKNIKPGWYIVNINKKDFFSQGNIPDLFRKFFSQKGFLLKE